MEIKYFRLIKTIAEEGSIVNSSGKLFLTQSALSHQLSSLEESLGFKVFHRSRNKWLLTEEGEVLYKLSNEVLDTIEKGLNTIQDIKEGAKGKIRISTECFTFYRGIPAFIQKMGLLYPEIDIEFKDSTHQPFTKVLSKEIDAVLVTSKPQSESLVSIEIFEDEIMALMHDEHVLAQKEFLEASDFLKIHLIIQSFPLSTVSVYQLFLKPNNIDPIKISAVVLTEICVEMVGANMGIMCLPKWALNPLKVPENLLLKKISINGLKRKHYLVLRKEDIGKKYIRDFVNNLQEDFMLK